MLEYFDEFINVKLIRFPDGEYVNGTWIPGTLGSSIDLWIIALQPITSNELQMMTDGEHIKNFRKTYCKELLRVREDKKDSDRIFYQNKTYEIHQVDDRNDLGDFYKVILREIND